MSTRRTTTWVAAAVSVVTCVVALLAVVISNLPSRPTPQARPTDLPTIPGASVVAIPSGGPTRALGFPVPPWIKGIKSPGGLDETWQFDIPTTEPDRVIAFYKRILPKAGYTIETDVTKQLGDEKVRWDIVFDGPAHGTITRDQAAGTVFVSVGDPLNP